MRSYTLVELVMVIVILGIVAAIGAPVLLETADAWSLSSRFQNFAVQSAIVTMNRMDRDIRRLKNDSSITNATLTELTFVDLDNNTIAYSRSVGNALMRNSDGLADNVTALTFTYYDDNGVSVSAPFSSPDTNIRRIKVGFSILAGTNTLNFSFQTRPQNLRRESEKFK